MISTPEIVDESLSLDVRSKVVGYLISATHNRSVQYDTYQVVILFIYSLEKSLVDLAISESTRFDSFKGLGELRVSFTATLATVAYLGRPLGKGSGLVGIIPSDLVDLVGEVSKQEALHRQFRFFG